eukprot:symbB.v1.2.039000.t1/scaffold6287.1/size19377/2
MGDWSSCSNVCGDGTRQRAVRCSGAELDQCNASTRPPEVENCSSNMCDLWNLGTWSSCSTQCGDGTQQRLVQCKDTSNCGKSTSPATEQACFETTACRWSVGSWSNCSDGCGLGFRNRQVTCAGGAALCSHLPRPTDRQSCEESRSLSGPSCGWAVGAWSECGENCGPQQREVTCSASKCFGKPPNADAATLVTCENQGNMTARFDVSLLMEDFSENLLSDLVLGTRQADRPLYELFRIYQPPASLPASPEPNACVCLPIESHEQPQHPHDYRAQEHHYTIASTTAAPAEATARTARTAEATAAGDSSNRRQHQQETAATEQQQQQQGNNNRSAQATTSTIGTMGVHNPGPQGCGKQAEEHVNCNHRR